MQVLAGSAGNFNPPPGWTPGGPPGTPGLPPACNPLSPEFDPFNCNPGGGFPGDDSAVPPPFGLPPGCDPTAPNFNPLDCTPGDFPLGKHRASRRLLRGQ
eukprot:354125-Chlamydomonas_euryale.AAC.5